MTDAPCSCPSRSCRYVVTPAEGAICPECGASIAPREFTLQARIHRREAMLARWASWAAALCLAIGVAIMVACLAHWYAEGAFSRLGIQHYDPDRPGSGRLSPLMGPTSAWIATSVASIVLVLSSRVLAADRARRAKRSILATATLLVLLGAVAIVLMTFDPSMM